MAQPEFQTVSEQFIGHYYQTFDNNRDGLSGLYREQSMLTWESETFLGAESIAAKLNGLPFGKVAHEIITKDAQPSIPQPDGSFNGALVLVTGVINLEDGSGFKFSQTFQLMKDGSGAWFVFNDLFKLSF